MSEDVLEWLKAERDRHAVLRDAAYTTDDWGAGNPHDDTCRWLFKAINEIERSRLIIGVMKEVLMNRIVDGHKP